MATTVSITCAASAGNVWLLEAAARPGRDQLRGAGEQWRRSEVMFDLGGLAIAAGDDEALGYVEEALHGIRPRGWSMSMTGVLAYLAEVVRRKRNPDLAQMYGCENHSQCARSARHPGGNGW
jgi:hypothetical protein